MTNVFVVWEIRFITQIVFDGFIKVANFSVWSDSCRVVWSTFSICLEKITLNLHNSLPEVVS